MTDPLEIAMEPIVALAALEAALDNGKKALLEGPLGPLATVSWPLLRSTLAKALEGALGAGLLAWLAGGWSAARELRELKEESESGNPALLKLGSHEMQGVLHPVVTVSCGGASLPPVTFDVPLTATVNATSLAIRNGHIVGLGGGECAIVMKIQYDGADLSGDLPLKTIALPGKYDFEPPGVAIP